MEAWKNKNLSVEERVEALLKEMSVREKLHQLGSFWKRSEDEAAPAPDPNRTAPAPDPDAIPRASSSDSGGQDPSAFADRKLDWDETIAGGLGQITRNWGTDPVSVQEGRAKLIKMQADVRGANAFGIPALVHEECLTGFTALGATVYPAAIAWGATWDPALIEKMASAIGTDMRAVGVHQGLSPLLDVARDYRWGRIEETCGEDPYLVGSLGTAYVKGLQSAGVMATLKHFAAYPASRGGRNHAPVSMGRRELEDYLLPSFEMAVREGGTHSVMNSYSDIDGIPAAISHFLLTEVLRERWGFDGIVVSDYWTVRFLQKMHRVAGSRMEAGIKALRAGLDVELPEASCYYEIEAGLETGAVKEEEIDRAVRRVLLQKARLGLLDEDWDAAADIAEDYDLDSPANREIAKQMAQESVVLLKNDSILPLSRDKKLAVIGPSWNEVRSYMGCYAFPNHVLSRFEDHGTGLDIKTLPEALQEITDSSVEFVVGTGFMDGDDDGIAQAVEAAKNADTAILTLGDIAGLFGQGTSGEGCDVEDLSLPGRQGELLDAVLETGTPVVLVLITGRPYAMGKYADRCAAIVQAFMPGVEGSDAIAGVLSGDLNPSGKLPIAIPNSPGGQPGTYLVPPLGWESEGISNLDPRPLYPFGFGISYTSFEYSDAEVSKRALELDDELEYSVTVTNTGERQGTEVVQLYYSDPVGEVVRPLKQLIGFTRVDLEAGQSARVTFRVHTDRFSFTGVDYKRIVEGGEIHLAAGTSSEQRLPAEVVELKAGRRIVGDDYVLTVPVVVKYL